MGGSRPISRRGLERNADKQVRNWAWSRHSQLWVPLEGQDGKHIYPVVQGCEMT